MSSREELLRELRLFLDTASEWHLAAFYADPEVERIVAELYRRWEKEGGRGEPLDYASEQELRRLLAVARRCSRLDLHEAFRRAFASRG